VLKGLIIIGTVLVQERNATDLLSFLRVPLFGRTQKDAPAERRAPTAKQNVGGNLE
jgi:simple sugar transport system permease protein